MNYFTGADPIKEEAEKRQRDAVIVAKWDCNTALNLCTIAGKPVSQDEQRRNFMATRAYYEAREQEQAFADMPEQPRLTEAEVDELARLDELKRKGHSLPHEI